MHGRKAGIVNNLQTAYVNNMVTHAATTLKKASTDGDIFKVARNVADQIAEANVDLESDTTVKIYDALLKHRNELKG